MICCTRFEAALAEGLVKQIEKPYDYPRHGFDINTKFTLVRYVGDPENEGWTNLFYMAYCPWCATVLTDDDSQ